MVTLIQNKHSGKTRGRDKWRGEKLGRINGKIAAKFIHPSDLGCLTSLKQAFHIPSTVDGNISMQFFGLNHWSSAHNNDDCFWTTLFVLESKKQTVVLFIGFILIVLESFCGIETGGNELCCWEGFVAPIDTFCLWWHFHYQHCLMWMFHWRFVPQNWMWCLFMLPVYWPLHWTHLQWHFHH